METIEYKWKVSTFFNLLIVSGCWKPISWTSTLKSFFYNLYTAFVLFLGISFTISQLCSTFTVENIEDFVSLTYITITVTVCCVKLINVLFRRKDIMQLINILLKEPYICTNHEEAELQTRYNDKIQKIVTVYVMVIETSAVVGISNSIATNWKRGELTYKGWFPYDYTTPILFPLTYTMQLIVVFTYSWVFAAVDMLFISLMMQLCCQFDILVSRLNSMTSGSKGILRKCIRHHDSIYRLTEMTNDTLQLTIFAQFFGSFLVLCLSMIQLLKADLLSAEFFATIIYLSTMLLQNFLYCWYGNKVKLKSVDLADAIFQLDWTTLSEKCKRMLLLVMTRTRIPIIFDCVHVITVNIDFFVALLKSSYSIYNVLQNTK